jgi:DNA polymerase III subunit beta
MKFRSERDTLVEALSAAARAVSTRAVGATTGLHLLVKGNELTATGTDLDLTVRAVIEVIGIDDGEAVVPARLVADAVRHLEAGAVTIDAGDEKVEISAARSRFSLRTFPPADFPSLPASGSRTTAVPAGELVEALRQVVRASSSDDARPLLTGVLFTNEDGVLRLVATDSYRLALCDLVGRTAIAGDRDLLVPSRALNELQRLCTSLGDDAEVGVALSDTEVTFLAGDATISSRLIDGAYPDYRQLIPASYPNRLHLGKETVLAALRRARLLVRDNTTSVRLTMHASGVDLKVVSHDLGDVEETVDGDFTGEELTIAFNPTYLIDGVDAVPGDEVVIETSDSARPAMVHGAEHDSFRYLLMPVRVQ